MYLVVSETGAVVTGVDEATEKVAGWLLEVPVIVTTGNLALLYNP